MICVPIKKKSLKSLLKDLLIAQKSADIVEIWFDELKINESGLNEIFDQAKKPILYKVTNQSNFEYVLKFKPAYIDLDINANSKLMKKAKKESPKTEIIISYHNFEETPGDKELKKIFSKIKKKGADIVKIATQANEFTDSLRMLQFLSENSGDTKLICICMGEHGKITRATGHLFANYLMYATLSAKNNTAPGQLTFEQLKNYNVT